MSILIKRATETLQCSLKKKFSLEEARKGCSPNLCVILEFII